MLEQTDAIRNEVLETITFLLSYPTVYPTHSPLTKQQIRTFTCTYH